MLPDETTWRWWIRHAQLNRVVPLLALLASRHDVRIHGVESEVRTLLVQSASWSVRLEHRLIHVADVLRRVGVDPIVLKGLATAHLDYADPVLRETGDIDILVSPGRQDEVLNALFADGWRLGYEIAGEHRRLYHAHTLERDGIELDVHQHIAHRALGLLLDTRRLMEDATPLRIGGSTLSALCDEDRLIHAAVHFHTSRGQTRRLSSAADVLVLTAKLRGRAIDVRNRADSFRIGTVFEMALRSAHLVARLPLPSEWELDPDGDPPPRDRLVELAYGGQTPRPIREELAYLRMLGMRDGARYVKGHIAPSGRGNNADSGTIDRLRGLASRAARRRQDR